MYQIITSSINLILKDENQLLLTFIPYPHNNFVMNFEIYLL